ncbi:exonuclease subunit SbcD [Acidovorax sp. NCPPB 3576]|uniref:exonuclease subunit SbcD n=1 Tax=Acidovorax sp. NCPPB 3576 TaxID=2940488 RepID=UPI00234BBAA7|nr:exonuclease subunit SbcD [Acidovorax sp. NCPPB 3576]WCM90878.1 exonuclease subunit SbcD [Acidovorax sp. NCPPB 3576]
MRLLHTSDWHLGQHFMGQTRQLEHLAFIDWLAGQVRAQGVDAVIVAGDVFDTGAPPSYARELYNRCVLAMRDAGAEFVVLGGNHDSVSMLGESRSLLAHLNTRVVPGMAERPEDQVLVLHTRAGVPAAVLCAVPFLRPRDLLLSQPGQSAADKQSALQASIRAHYDALHVLALERSAALGGLPIVATGHLTTVGASASESVREIYVGTLEAFPTNAFPPADYIALGHIHQPQKVGGLEHVRYSGSPIPLSFDEARQRKEVLLVDFDLAGLKSVTPLPVPCFQPLASVRGRLVDLPAAFAEAANLGHDALPVWIEVEVAHDDYLADLQLRVAKMAEGLPIQILRVRRARNALPASLDSSAGETLDELGPAEVFARRLASQSLEPALEERLSALYRTVLADLQERPAP